MNNVKRDGEHIIRATTAILNDYDDDEVSPSRAPSRELVPSSRGTMLRYGYQPAHKTALALPPYAARPVEFTRATGKEGFLPTSRKDVEDDRRPSVPRLTTTRIILRRSTDAFRVIKIDVWYMTHA